MAKFDSQLDLVEHVLKHRTTNRGLAIMANPLQRRYHSKESKDSSKKTTSSFGDDVRNLIEQYKL